MKSLIVPPVDWTLLRDEISEIDGLSAGERVRLDRSYAYLVATHLKARFFEQRRLISIIARSNAKAGEL